MMTHEEKITILVNQRPFHLEDSQVDSEKIKSMVGGAEDYEVWKVIKSPDPEGKLPIDDIMISGSVEIKSGDKFRVVPPGTFGAAATAPQQFLQEIEELKSKGFDEELVSGANILYLIINDYQLPPGYNKTATRLLLKVPVSYPNGNIDMFWVNPDLRLKNGGSPDSTSEEIILKQRWLRFSWHPKKWNPGEDNLVTYLEFVNRRLKQLR